MGPMTKRPVLIAVVDDEESVVRALHRLLRSAGLLVQGFSNGQLFLNSIKEHSYDGVILDLHMPVMDGFEVQARLAEVRPELPLIIVTGHDTPDSYNRAMECGAYAYLRKPVDGRTLLSTIERIVGSANVDSHNCHEDE